VKDPRQPGLFGEPPARRVAGVGPAEIPPALRRLAGTLPRGLRMGTSSWSFPGWRGLVYDREAGKSLLARSGLAAYAQHPLLRAVGIDRTYYAPLPAATFRDYAQSVPEEFRFLVKAWSGCTAPRRESEEGLLEDNPVFLDASCAAAEVVAPFVEGLGGRAGALLFQFPPLGGALVRQPGRFAERLAGFLGALPRGPVYAVELRDRELLCADYVAALCAAGARHCLNLHPRMPDIDRQREVAGDTVGAPLVVRWMLHGGLGYEGALRRYEPFDRIVDEDRSSRAAVARACVTHLRREEEVIVVANNKAEGSAPLTIARLAEAIAGSGDLVVESVP
jgi:uncharacterized protein YecE (DUF72 family)